MRCPVCGEEMNEIEVGTVIVDGCKNCGGVWFDNKELKVIEEEGEVNSEFEEFLNGSEANFNGDKPYKCPRCTNIPLWKHYIHKRKARADECPVCGGIWLDVGEFDAVFEDYKAEKEIRDYMENQERLSKEKCREYFDQLAEQERKLRERLKIEIQRLMLEVDDIERIRRIEEKSSIFRNQLKLKFDEAVERIDALDKLKNEVKETQRKQKELQQRLQSIEREVVLEEKFYNSLEDFDSGISKIREKINKLKIN